jgi:D-sedoheptulose 7-phosphate isomerase
MIRRQLEIPPLPSRQTPLPSGMDHIRALRDPLLELERELPRIQRWARQLAVLLTSGGRLLACGNGGSAAEAQHLTGELVGRYRDDRRPLSAISLHAESSSFTAIGNDYGADEVFARQVLAHGRPNDVLVAISTSGKSANVLKAVQAARESSLLTWAISGPGPNPLSRMCHDSLCVAARETATVQEIHLVVVHLLCAALDIEVGASLPEPDEVH